MDDDCNLYTAGTDPTGWGLPAHPHPSVNTFDAMISKVTQDGIYVWHTYQGGKGWDEATSLCLGESGDIYVTGYSSDAWTVGTPPVKVFAGTFDGWVAKLDQSAALQWYTFIGGGGEDRGNAMSAYGSGMIPVVGSSNTSWGKPLRKYSGKQDGFAAILRQNNSSLLASTFLGGDKDDFAYSVFPDGLNSVVIAGESYASWGNPQIPSAGPIHRRP